MTFRTTVVLILALVCGAFAAVGVSQLSRQPVVGPANVETVPVLVTAVDVPRGGVLTGNVVKTENWPKQFVPPGAVSDLAQVADRSVLVPLVPGEPILERKLASKDAGRGLASLIPMGMRAFTIQTPQASAGVGGFILPGNRVDVLLTTTGNAGPLDATGGASTTTLLQNVEILAVAQQLDAPQDNKVSSNVQHVTLLVHPDQAAKLDLAMNQGILHLTLRNPEDNDDAATAPATMAQLRFYQEPPAPQSGALGRIFGRMSSAVLTGIGNAVLRETPDTQAGSDEAVPQGAVGEIAVAAKSNATAQIQTLRGVHRGSIRIEAFE